MNLGPYPTAARARTALREAGYVLAFTKGGKPDKWVHPDSRKERAVRRQTKGSGWVIVDYPERLTTRMKVSRG